MRTKHRSSVPATVFVAGLLLAVAGGMPAEAGILYRGAQTLEERIGRVELRRAYGQPLEVLNPCEENFNGCVEEHVYDEVIRIDFFSGLRKAEGDAVATIEEPVGTIYLATHFADEDRATFDADLDRTLGNLPADAFDSAFAGLGPMEQPFDSATLSALSRIPSWACFSSGGDTSMTMRFHRQMEGERLAGTGATRYIRPPTTVCDGMRRATDGVEPRVLRTLASPTRLREVVVEHRDVLTLDFSDSRAHLDRPNEVLLVKQERPRTGSLEGSFRTEDGNLSRATHAERGWRFDAWAEPASIPLSAIDNGWLHALTVTTVDREFGAQPDEKVAGRTVLLAAYLPTPPAAQLSSPLPDGSLPVSESGRLADVDIEPAAEAVYPRIDRGAFLDRLVGELADHRVVATGRLANWLGRPSAGLETEGWLVVVCKGGGAADYYVPPTTAVNRVTNAASFCASLGTRLN